MRKKLTRGQKAAATRKANAALKNIKDPWEVSEYKVGDTLKIRLPNDYIKSDGPTNSIGSTMILLEQSINELIQRINTQTQRIKDMM